MYFVLSFTMFTFVPSKNCCVTFLSFQKMKERLLKIITAEGLSPALLADKIGVQRSGISHILSGRNNPRMDFFQKLLTHFPKLNAEWLILGQGTMYTQTDSHDLFASAEPSETVKNTQHTPIIPDMPQNLSSAEGNPKKNLDRTPEILPSAEPKKTIEKIVVFHTDKTFAVYFPEEK